MKHANLVTFIFLAAFSLIAIPALAGENTSITAGIRTVTDDTGATVILHGIPQRIVSLSPANTEILYSLGLGDRVVGVTDYCNYPLEATTKPVIGGYSTVSVEKVLAQKPDLILAAYGNGADVVNRLEGLNQTVIVLNPADINGVLDDIAMVGHATGTDENATALVSSLKARIAAVERNASALPAHPKVAHIVWNDPLYVSGNGTFQDQVITTAGGTNAFADKQFWTTVGVEDFISANPDILIVNSGSGMGGTEDSIALALENESRYANVAAIKNHHVYVVDSDTMDRGGPRIVDALEIVAADINAAEASGTAKTQTQEAPGFETALALGACAAVFTLCALRKK